MKKVNIFKSDNNEWTCSIHYSSIHSDPYSIVCKPLCISPDIPRTELLGIFDSTKNETGTTFSQRHTIQHYYKIIINIFKNRFISHLISRPRRFFITSSFQILENKKYKK